MADNNKEGITIYFEGDTVRFDKSANGIEKALKVLQAQTKALNKQFSDSKSLDDLNKKIRSLRQEYNLSVQATKKWSDEWKQAKVQYDALYGKQRTAEQEKEFKRIKKYMEAAMKAYETSVGRTIKIRNELKQCYAIAEDLAKQPNKFQESLESVGNTLTTIGDKTKALSKTMQKFLTESVKDAINFEDAFAEVRKTLTIEGDDAEERYQAIATALRDLSTTVPTTADNLAKIAGLAGQMGVSEEYIVKFTKAMVDFGNATNITAEEAAQDIAQIYNVIGKGGDYSDLDALLSTIVELGNNSATTEKDIVEMFRNISSAASRVGMNQSQMVALASTLSSLGLDKGGASAISNIMQQIDIAVDTNSKKLTDWANAAGMSVNDFKKAWGEDAASALASLLENLKQTVDAGGNLNEEFQDLGIKELRRVDTLGRLVNAQELYSTSLQMAADAYEKGNALSNEAEKRYGTLKSQIQILTNKINEFKRTIGDQLTPILSQMVGFAGKLLDIINAMPGGVATLITLVTTFMAILSPLTSVLGKILGNNIALTNTVKNLISFMGTAKGILLGVAGAFILLYTQNENFRNAVNKTVAEIWEHLKPALENLWSILKTVWDILGLIVNKFQELWVQFTNSAPAKAIIDTFKAIIEIIEILIDVVAGVIEGFATIFKWLGKVIGLESEVQANMPRSVSVLESGGFNGMASGGMVVNNSFTINGTEQLSNSRLIEVADIITDRVNENLGRMV